MVKRSARPILLCGVKCVNRDQCARAICKHDITQCANLKSSEQFYRITGHKDRQTKSAC